MTDRVSNARQRGSVAEEREIVPARQRPSNARPRVFQPPQRETLTAPEITGSTASFAAADLFIRAGDSSPVFTDVITDPSGNPITTLASVRLILRSLQSLAPVSLTGAATVISGASVQYAWSTTDTQNAGPGLYNAEWECVLQNGETYTFPNNGYRTVSIGETLTSAPQELVSVADAKSYMNISSGETDQDEKIERFIAALRPVVESITGPIIPTQFEEWHDGGQGWITLSNAPRVSLGTQPLLIVQACSEYVGPIEWPLSIIQTPDQASIYSCMPELRLGRVVRRTTGGGAIAFSDQGPQSVHVIYEAGQSVVPPNVYEGTLELVRLNYQRTQQQASAPGPYPGGRGGGAAGDGAQAPAGFIWGRASKLLAPTRRFPAIA